jgi:hypothetical protein
LVGGKTETGNALDNGSEIKMDEKICKNCIFWKCDSGEKYPPTGIKYRVDMEFRYGHCYGPAEDNSDCSDMKSDQIAVNCSHDGGIIMGENFGCIHFKNDK